MRVRVKQSLIHFLSLSLTEDSIPHTTHAITGRPPDIRSRLKSTQSHSFALCVTVSLLRTRRMERFCNVSKRKYMRCLLKRTYQCLGMEIGDLCVSVFEYLFQFSSLSLSLFLSPFHSLPSLVIYSPLSYPYFLSLSLSSVTQTRE